MSENYTFFFPITEDLVGEEIEAWVVVKEGGENDFEPRLYATAYPAPREARTLVLKK